MNLRLSLRYFLSVLVSFCIVFSSSFCGIAKADNTTVQAYDIISSSNDGIATSIASVSDFDISFSVGEYNINTDTYTFGSATSKVSTDGKIPSYADARYTFNYDTNKCIALKVKLSDFSSLSDLRFVLGRFHLSLFNGSSLISANRYYMDLSKARPFEAYADITWGGTLNYGSTHTSSSATSSAAISPNSISNFPNTANYDLLLDLSGSFDVPDKTLWKNYYEHPDGTNLYNVYIKDITLVFTYFINDAFYNVSTGNLFLDNISVGDTSSLYLYCGTNYCVLSGSSYGDSSGISSLGVSLNNSIQNLSSNVSTQINQVKTAISNSTNTITTKIDTMSQDIQTGLQNVVQSAQQNTQNIINTVTTKVDEVKTGITEVKDSIIDLPNKIQEMLIGLVVPDEDTINAKYAEFDELLSSRFGLIYQSADIIHDFADSFQTQAVMTVDSGGVITMPSVTVNLAGTQFTFGGYDVDIIPDGFEFLQQALRLAISMVCTVVFVNMCKNKLEAILK